MQKFLWADVVIYQMPGWWMGAPWTVKKYLDEVFTAGVQRIARTMRTFGGATSAIRLLASRHHAGASLADTTERARDIGAIKASDLEGLVREAFDPAAAQIVAVGDPASLSEILRDARVIRPITVLDGL